MQMQSICDLNESLPKFNKNMCCAQFYTFQTRLSGMLNSKYPRPPMNLHKNQLYLLKQDSKTFNSMLANVKIIGTSLSP